MGQKKKRIEDRRLLDHVKSFRCVACGGFPTDPAHIRSKGSGGPDIHQNLMSLCREHHTDQHRRGWVDFAHRNPEVLTDLIRKGWEISDKLYHPVVYSDMRSDE